MGGRLKLEIQFSFLGDVDTSLCTLRPGRQATTWGVRWIYTIPSLKVRTPDTGHASRVTDLLDLMPQGLLCQTNN